MARRVVTTELSLDYFTCRGWLRHVSASQTCSGGFSTSVAGDENPTESNFSILQEKKKAAMEAESKIVKRIRSLRNPTADPGASCRQKCRQNPPVLSSDPPRGGAHIATAHRGGRERAQQHRVVKR